MSKNWANGYKGSALYNRRVQVNKLVRQGFSQKEIAEQLGVTRRVVQGDVAYARKEKTRVNVISRYDMRED